MNQMEPSWTLSDLSAKVALALSEGYEGQSNGQVRDVPDPRTIRYYTTLGLVDRPLEMRGRTALYGRRHLLQIVAIKRLQARGLALSAIQEELLGLSPRALERLADLPGGIALGEGDSRSAGRTKNFWKEEPAAVPSGPAGSSGPSGFSPGLLQLLELREGAGLLLKPERTITPEDLEILRTAATPLLKALEARRLLQRLLK